VYHPPIKKDEVIMTNTLTVEETNATSTLAEITVATNNFLLTAQDRCDACGAQAYYQVNFGETSKLMFCSHHYNANKAKLLKTAVNVRDESARLS
jgi:hypothetical protein